MQINSASEVRIIIMFPEEATENLFSITALPWVNYSSLELHYSNEEIMLSPIVTWGKYVRKEGRLMLPVTMRVHHAVCDGFHVAKFFNKIEKIMPEIVRELVEFQFAREQRIRL